MTSRSFDLRHKRARSRQTGAAFVESLIVIGLIIVAMQCIWWMFQYTLFQHRAHVEARAKAWEYALKGCGEADVKGGLGGLSKGSDPSSTGLDANSENSPPWFALSQANTATVDLPLPQEIFGTSTVAAKESFSCNEKGGAQHLELFGGNPDSKGMVDDTLN